MIGVLWALFQPWVWRMAWRESRARRRRLLLFGSSIVLGIAALVGIGSLRDTVQRTMDEQAKSLLGADLVIAGRSAFGEAEEALFRELGGRQARETDFSSMVVFPGKEGTRLVQVRVLEGPFPFYGELEAEPMGAVDTWQREGGALVDETLLVQYGVDVGAEVRVGDLTARVVGRLKRVPGDAVAFATLAPRIYLAKSALDRAGGLKQGSLARYKQYFAFTPGTDVEALIGKVKQRMETLRLGHNTVDRRREDLGRSLDNMSHFLSLIGFVALFLGGIGVASAVHTHVREKLAHVAVLRCLGVEQSRSFAIYLAQAVALGLFASVAGASVGVLVQMLLPQLVGDFLTVRVNFGVSWAALGEGMILGFICCVLFALLPLLAIRRVSPMAVLRLSALGSGRNSAWDPAVILSVLALAGLVVGFGVWHTKPWKNGLWFGGGLLGALALLALLGRVLTWGLRRLRFSFLPYGWRQGVTNLHRPQNRTSLLLIALGLGCFLLLTLQLVQDNLLNQLRTGRDPGRANTVLFDIQPDQQEGVAALVKAQGFEVLETAPIVTMRLSALKGVTVEDLLTQTNRNIPKWALRREYRSTWRTQLGDAEQVVAGVWHGDRKAGADITEVSIEEGIARDLGLGLGDELRVDIQGVPLTARIASIRKVDWRRVQPNFFLVFPEGVLEGAPSFYVMTTHTASATEAAKLQRAVVDRFPNVSTIDLTLVLQTLDGLLEKVGLAIRFVAWFTLGTGILVLVGATMVSRQQRLREVVLWRTLGASSGHVRSMLIAEYLALGLLAGLGGALLSAGCAWWLSLRIFQMPFQPPFAVLLTGVLVLTGLTLLVGLLGNQVALRRPPLEVLRGEA